MTTLNYAKTQRRVKTFSEVSEIQQRVRATELTNYRTIAADRNKPDGLTSNDEKNMDKAVTNVSKTLADSPVLLK